MSRYGKKKANQMFFEWVFKKPGWRVLPPAYPGLGQCWEPYGHNE